MFAQEAALKASAQADALGAIHASGRGSPGRAVPHRHDDRAERWLRREPRPRRRQSRRRTAPERARERPGHRRIIAWYDVTGDEVALRAALRATDCVLAIRARPGAGSAMRTRTCRALPRRNVEMGKAFLALDRSTGDRRWLFEARDRGLRRRTFVDAGTGAFIAAASPEAGTWRSRSSSARTT